MISSRERGVQPLDALLNKLKLKNSNLVDASKEQLTHKMVARGRKGRFLTRHSQWKICNALNACQPEKKYRLEDIFNY